MEDYFERRDLTAPAEEPLKKIPRFLQRVLPENRDLKILDLGCGFGSMLLSFRSAGYQDLKGVDSSQRAVEYCQNQGLKVERAMVGDFLNRNQEQYDLVIMTHVLEHLAKEEVISVLTKIYHSLLGENGQLFLTVPNAQASTGCYAMFGDFTHQTIYTSDSLIYVLRAAGFSKISFLDIDCTSEIPPLKKILRKAALFIYKGVIGAINRIPHTYYRPGGVDILSFEIKVIAQK
ncbi:MAG TPA: class I SAM-dependent methyltransferase [Candidatus Methylomirabilis sp.]|nr:class I SAM-dependent methyltransferase [Candidatus Methylomirabilis sp.]